MRPFRFTLLLLFLLSAISNLSWCEERTLSVAVVAPLTGPSKGSGISIAQAVQLYFDQLNAGEQYNGVKINVELYDDENRVEEAARQAKKIAGSDCIAVIGHNVSSTTLVGVETYSEAQIPLLVPTATNVDITLNRPWVYRVIYNDKTQAKSLVEYLKRVVAVEKVTVISEAEIYGAYIGKVFVEEAVKESLTIVDHWKLQKGGENIDRVVQSIVNKVEAGEDVGYILLALNELEAVEVVRKLRDAGMKNVFVGPDSLSSLSFQEKFQEFPFEVENPGFYTNGLMTSAPYIQDIANREGQIFRKNYVEKYNLKPDWRAAYSYDCAKVLHAVLKEMMDKSSINTLSLSEIREGIRQELSQLTTAAKGVDGITGGIYFDRNGDSPKPVNIGVFQRGKTISALWQLKEITNPRTIKNLAESLKSKKIIKVGENYVYKTDIVYAGVEVKKITDIDVNSGTCLLEFLFWLRHPETETKPEEIIFTSAAEALEEFELVQKTKHDIYCYQMYRCKGRFYMDYKSESEYLFNKHFVGIQFRHKTLSSSEIFYVPDLSGMDTLQLKDIKLSSGWKILNSISYKDSYFNKVLGDPLHINKSDGLYEQIRFNSEIEFEQEYYSLRGKIPSTYSWILAPLSLFFFFFLIIFFRRIDEYRKLLFLFCIRAALLLLALLSAEVLVMDWALNSGNAYNLNITRVLFDIFYWLFVGHAVAQLIRLLLFIPIEVKAKRAIPNVIKGFVYFIVYLLASFAIISFVFQKPLTGLLATSGLFAMIIGLAIQFNLSNVFSGIAVGLEHPFQVGHYIQVGSHGKGEVIDMGWRTTRIKNRLGQSVCIPNSSVAEEVVTNFTTKDGTYKFLLNLSVAKGQDPEEVKNLLVEVMEEVKEVSKGRAIFEGVSDWSLEFILIWTGQGYKTRWMTKDRVYGAIIKKFKENGIKFATRNQEIKIQK